MEYVWDISIHVWKWEIETVKVNSKKGVEEQGDYLRRQTKLEYNIYLYMEISQWNPMNNYRVLIKTFVFCFVLF
jgi:hypothetical protein